MNETCTSLWNTLLDIDMNQRYYGHLCRRYARRELVLKIFVAAASSTSIASWKLWSNTQGWCNWSTAWEILTGTSAVAAVAMPILNFSKTSQRAADLRGRYAALLVDYEGLWLQTKSLSEDALRRKYISVREKESELSHLEADMPRDKDLILKCQEEVEKGRGLK